MLSGWGKATFDGLVSAKDWAAANPDFMVELVKQIAKADAAYRDDPKAWTASSEMVKKIVGLVGGDPEAVGSISLKTRRAFSRSCSSGCVLPAAHRASSRGAYPPV